MLIPENKETQGHKPATIFEKRKRSIKIYLANPSSTVRGALHDSTAADNALDSNHTESATANEVTHNTVVNMRKTSGQDLASRFGPSLYLRQPNAHQMSPLNLTQ